MGDVPAELALPRRETPRLKIPRGSLAIATTMTCIFPLETPCGWHLIGRSPVALWETRPRPRALLAPGDKVTFGRCRCANMRTCWRRQPRVRSRSCQATRRWERPHECGTARPVARSYDHDSGSRAARDISSSASRQAARLIPSSLRAANVLAGNPPDFGALEVLYAGPTLAVEAPSARLAFVGAEAMIQVFADGRCDLRPPGGDDAKHPSAARRNCPHRVACARRRALHRGRGWFRHRAPARQHVDLHPRAAWEAGTGAR